MGHLLEHGLHARGALATARDVIAHDVARVQVDKLLWRESGGNGQRETNALLHYYTKNDCHTTI